MSSLLLLLPILFGSLLALTAMREKHPLFVLPLGCGIGTVTGLMLLDLFLQSGLPLPEAMYALYLSFFVASLLLGWKVSRKLEIPSFARRSLAPGVRVYLLVGGALVYYVSMALSFMEIDPDFWVHTPMQAQLLNGVYPPVNPFLPDIVYGGHFAKDLLVVAVSWTSGFDLLACHAPVTSFLQVNAFLLLFLAGYSERGQYAGVFVSFLVFTGANVGFRGGWLDTLANNTSLANLHTALLMFLLMRTLFRKVSVAEVLTTGIVFGGLAWTYETNFVPICAGLGLLALFTMVRGKFTARRAGLAVLLCSLACLCGLIYGGLLGDLLLKAVKAEAPAAQNERVQAQEVTISVQFPKEQLFQVKLTRPGEVFSIAYLIYEPLGKRFKDPGNIGYVSLFNPVFLRMHWLAFYLAPLTLWTLWRGFVGEDEPFPFGLFLCCLGGTSLLIPALVNFGIWEEEVFRWMFTAGWAFAGALGVALGGVCERCSAAGLWRIEGEKVRFGRPFLNGLGVLVLAALLGYPVIHITRDKLKALPQGHSVWLPYTQESWLDYHFHELGLSPAQADLARELRGRVRPRDVLVSNFSTTSYHSMKQEEAFLGLCGALPLGHALPTNFERLGTPPFRMDAPTRAFWATGDPELLRAEQPDWVYYQTTERGVPPNGLAKVLETSDSQGRYEIYRFTLPELHRDNLGADEAAGLRVEKFEPTGPLTTEAYLPGKLLLRSEKSIAGSFLLEYRFPEHPLEKGLTQPVNLNLGSRGEESIPIHFVTPHHSGKFEVEFVLRTGSREIVLGHREIVVDNKAAWDKLRLSLESKDESGLRITVENGGELPVRVDGFARVLPEDEVYLDLQPVSFSLAAKESVSLKLFWDSTKGEPELIRFIEGDRQRDFLLGRNREETSSINRSTGRCFCCWRYRSGSAGYWRGTG